MKRCVIVGGADINNYEYIKSCLRNEVLPCRTAKVFVNEGKLLLTKIK